MDWWLDGTRGGSPVITPAAGTLLLMVENPMAFHRVFYDFGAGGGATQFQIFFRGRGAA